jgi:hypothetical protein
MMCQGKCIEAMNRSLKRNILINEFKMKYFTWNLFLILLKSINIEN